MDNVKCAKKIWELPKSKTFVPKKNNTSVKKNQKWGNFKTPFLKIGPN